MGGPEYRSMTNLTISAAGKPPSFARGLPFTVEIPAGEATVADVKASIASKFPKASGSSKFHTQGDLLRPGLVLSKSSKNFFERGEEIALGRNETEGYRDYRRGRIICEGLGTADQLEDGVFGRIRAFSQLLSSLCLG